MTREAMSSSSRTWARRCLLALALAIAATCAGDVALRAQNDGTPANALQIRDRLAVAADRIGVRPLGSDDPLLFHSRLVEIDGKLTVGFRDIGLAARGTGTMARPIQDWDPDGAGASASAPSAIRTPTIGWFVRPMEVRHTIAMKQADVTVPLRGASERHFRRSKAGSIARGRTVPSSALTQRGN
jgi:hypothetical protein